MDIKKDIKKVETTHTTLTIDDYDIKEFLEKEDHEIPLLAKMYVKAVHGEKIFIDSDNPIIIEYTKESITTE